MQSDQSLCRSLDYSLGVKLLAEHHSEFLTLKGGCTGSSESTLVKMPHCWKSHVMAKCTETLLSLFIRCSVPGVVLMIFACFLTFYTHTSTALQEVPYAGLFSQIK